MPSMTRRSGLLALALTPLAARLVGATGRPGRRPARKWADVPARELIRQRHLPDVPLLTQRGETVHFYDDLVKDKKVVINFIYTRCQGICSPVTANLARVQKLLDGRVGRDIFFYSVSLKPDEDTPAALADYAALHDVGPGWLFLTGQPADVELLRGMLGFKYDDPAEDADKSNHTGMLRIGNEPYLRWSMCEGQADPKWIAKSILLEMDGPTRPAALATAG